MIELRDYQQKAITSLFEYLYRNPRKNPCLVCPTGSGKSVIIAEFCRYSITTWGDTKILVLSHQKELIMQDARALKRHWEDADIGIYSAALGCKQLEQPVIYASIQSIYKVSGIRFDVILIDEAHLVNNEEHGMYRRFIERARPSFVIGFTATPYRLGQGMLTDEPSIFSDIIDVISIKELQKQGYLALLRSKSTSVHYDLSKVRVRGGEYIESDLQQATSEFSTNESVCDEIIRSGRYFNRKHWLIFCTGVEHAMTIAGMLNERGISCVYVTGSMSQQEREDVLWQFTSGNATAICNANLLTTGFDYPDIDMIAMLRATLSPGLYMQCLGRGLRLKSDTNKDCLVLDFAENVMRHGPITDVLPPSSRKKGGKLGAVPCKECPECLEIVTIQTEVCPCCGYEFPKNKRIWQLYNGDVNGGGYERHEEYSWLWYQTTSRTNAKPMFVVEHKLSDLSEPVREFFLYEHDGYAFEKTIKLAKLYCDRFNINFEDYYTGKTTPVGKKIYRWEDLMSELASHEHPAVVITERKNGRFRNVIDRLWEEDIKQIELEVRELKDKADETRRTYIG